jgi:3-isopropylmalate dehydratase small subunit
MVYLASPAVVAASAVAGYITTPDQIPAAPAVFQPAIPPADRHAGISSSAGSVDSATVQGAGRPTLVEGHVWLIRKDDIDTDMIFHNRYLTITDIREMGQYSFDNLKGYEDFARKARPGDILVTQKNFGAGSSRQQAVDCFLSLGISCILAESYGAIYERNAINAALPILTYNPVELNTLDLQDGDLIRVDFETGEVTNLKNKRSARINRFYDAQLAIYRNGGLL